MRISADPSKFNSWTHSAVHRIAATAMERCVVCSSRTSVLCRYRGYGCVPWCYPRKGLRCSVKGRSVSQSSQTEVFLESIDDADGSTVSIDVDIAGVREEVRGVGVCLCWGVVWLNFEVYVAVTVDSGRDR
jgi:hypothetical protein